MSHTDDITIAIESIRMASIKCSPELLRAVDRLPDRVVAGALSPKRKAG